MKVLSWKCRGLGSKVKEYSMRDLIWISQPDLLLIQETKLEKETFLQLSKKIWKKGGGLAIISRGSSGGIGTLWDDQKFELIESKHHIHCILTKLLHKETNIQVILFNIYVPVIFVENKDCWNCLREVRSNTMLENIVLAGDLNIILHQA